MTTSRPSRQVRRRRFLAALFGLYLVVLAFIAFWPSPVDSGSAGGTLRTVLAWLHEHGAPGWFNYNFVEFTANILLFVPFGFLGAAYVDRRWVWAVPVAGFCISGCIELGQLLFRPDRFATMNDLVANTLGTACGALPVKVFIPERKDPSIAVWHP
ncbi:VanZ family protein [Arthrobacter sp. 3Tela_A]|uniref:VanZ family protein n=1 Tax=Arthrobacter sp. 3Tela_A TaxID=3093743 RepID=UPI003BB6BCDF